MCLPLSTIFAALLLSTQGLQATDAPEVEAETDEATKLAKQLFNPISSLVAAAASWIRRSNQNDPTRNDEILKEKPCMKGIKR